MTKTCSKCGQEFTALVGYQRMCLPCMEDMLANPEGNYQIGQVNPNVSWGEGLE